MSNYPPPPPNNNGNPPSSYPYPYPPQYYPYPPQQQYPATVPAQQPYPYYPHPQQYPYPAPAHQQQPSGQPPPVNRATKPRTVSSSAAAGSSAPAVNMNNGILVPMYIYPGGAQNEKYYDALIAAAKKYPHVTFYVILNPNSGPGPKQDPNYMKMAERLKSASCQLLCYIATTYAKKPEQKVLDELTAFTSQYPNMFTGVFFDEMQTDDKRYYASLTRAVHSRGLPLVIANPGGSVPDSYYDSVPDLPDVIVIHENSSYPRDCDYKTDPSYRKRKAILVHSQPLNAQFVSIAKRYCSMMFLTDDLMPNPWDVLPSYWDSFVAAVASNS